MPYIIIRAQARCNVHISRPSHDVIHFNLNGYILFHYRLVQVLLFLLNDCLRMMKGISSIQLTMEQLRLPIRQLSPASLPS